MLGLGQYRTLVFDCDGVILDSNAAKTQAFHDVVGAEYGPVAADRLVAYHRDNGGISRYRKFEYLLEVILGRPLDREVVMALSERFGARVRDRLMQCPVAPGLAELRAMLGDSSWMVVSGGAQDELRDVFAARGLDRLFDGGIHGSPDTKHEILAREIGSGRLALPGLFLGDSALDHRAATDAGLDFVFVHGWTEFDGWRRYCAEHAVGTVAGLRELLPDDAPTERRQG